MCRASRGPVTVATGGSVGGRISGPYTRPSTSRLAQPRRPRRSLWLRPDRTRYAAWVRWVSTTPPTTSRASHGSGPVMTTQPSTAEACRRKARCAEASCRLLSHCRARSSTWKRRASAT